MVGLVLSDATEAVVKTAVRRKQILAQVATALPDFALAATFLITWIFPRALGENRIASLMLLMLFEFIAVHSSIVMGHVLGLGQSRALKSAVLVGLGIVYSILTGAIALALDTWWPVLALWGLALNRLMLVWSARVLERREREAVAIGWVAGVLFYVTLAMATAFLPIPALGVTPAVWEPQRPAGTGVWLDQPQRVLAFGLLYFIAMGLTEISIEKWLKRPPPGHHPLDR
ncbi:MAG TPA: hypothetical protein VER55_09490 [Ardenticatenaceae bacterium]|nr:hypothetical protein [Ardenticatenaceae bacterium]